MATEKLDEEEIVEIDVGDSDESYARKLVTA